ncbi:oxidoreductase [Alkalimonas delamerensis]|uniref:Oxidoreductase n=1 Tax=Alkalimonas delamerensis TaxID=265981 RepID=A0ABT9GU47_9GAMM|nr:oxidoreductase [Alkalimonas delamerensis]MDP4530409.1 oxidoreductase [Alkalimonas delamerensis]
MSLDGILMILWYAAKPWLWLIVLLILVLVASLWLGRQRQGKAHTLLWLIAIGAGLAGMIVAPWFTHSKLSYVATWPDRLVLLVIGIGITLYCWCLLKNWLRQP